MSSFINYKVDRSCYFDTLLIELTKYIQDHVCMRRTMKGWCHPDVLLTSILEANEQCLWVMLGSGSIALHFRREGGLP